MGPGHYDFAGGSVLEIQLGELHAWKQTTETERHWRTLPEARTGSDETEHRILHFFIHKSGLATYYISYFL